MAKIKGWSKGADKYSQQSWTNSSRGEEVRVVPYRGGNWQVLLISDSGARSLDRYSSSRSMATSVALDYMRRHPHG